MKPIYIHGNTLYAWVIAVALATHKNSVFICTDATNLDDHLLEQCSEALAQKVKQLHTENRIILRATIAADGLHQLHFITYNEPTADIFNHLTAILSKTTADVSFIISSQMNIGCLDSLETDTAKHESSHERQINIVGLPLFIREGSALEDFENPWLLLVSGSQNSTQLLLELLAPCIKPQTKVMTVSHRTGECIRLGTNAMLATRISFINEMSILAENVEVDIATIAEGIGADPRIGSSYLDAGCGFGGPKFSEDIERYLTISTLKLGHPGLIKTVLTINDFQRETLFRKVWRYFGGNLTSKHIAIWGCAYKPLSHSIEYSPIHPLLSALWAQGCYTHVYDPMAGMVLGQQHAKHPLLTIAQSATQAIDQADALLIITAWDEFKTFDMTSLSRYMTHPAVFDGRNIYTPSTMQALDIDYFGVGRGKTI